MARLYRKIGHFYNFLLIFKHEFDTVSLYSPKLFGGKWFARYLPYLGMVKLVSHSLMMSPLDIENDRTLKQNRSIL